MKRLFAAFVIIVVALSLLSGRAPRFGDMYECRIITDVEVSLNMDGDYEQVDCEEFMSAVEHGKRVFVEFQAFHEVHLFDDEGIRYKLFLSKNMSFFRVDSDVFRLSTRSRRHLVRLTGLSQ